MPQVAFRIEAYENMTNNVKPSGEDDSATSYDGAVPVEKCVKDLCKKMGLAFENNGVHSMLENPYLFGSLNDQLKKLVQSSHFLHVAQTGTLAIWPESGARSGTVEVSKETGMRNAPTF